MKPKREFFKAIPAAYIVFEKTDEILLLLRSNTTYFDDYFSLPAGHVERDESLKAAAAREAKEEVGVIIDPKDLRLVHILNRPAVERNGDTRIDCFFATRAWKGRITNMEPAKCAELRWVKRDKLPDNMVPEVRQAVEAINNGSIESEFDWDRIKSAT